MRAALLLAAYALAVAWFLPAPLARLTSRGVRARLGLGAWLAAVASALVSAGLAFYLLSRTAAGDWTQLTAAVCREVAGNACTPDVYQSELYETGVVVATVLAALAVGVVAWRGGP
jgi:hypothetical protein